MWRRPRRACFDGVDRGRPATARATTRAVVGAAGWAMDSVLPEGVAVHVRRTANLHTGGAIRER